MYASVAVILFGLLAVANAGFTGYGPIYGQFLNNHVNGAQAGALGAQAGQRDGFGFGAFNGFNRLGLHRGFGFGRGLNGLNGLNGFNNLYGFNNGFNGFNNGFNSGLYGRGSFQGGFQGFGAPFGGAHNNFRGGLPFQGGYHYGYTAGPLGYGRFLF